MILSTGRRPPLLRVIARTLHLLSCGGRALPQLLQTHSTTIPPNTTVSCIGAKACLHLRLRHAVQSFTPSLQPRPRHANPNGTPRSSRSATRMCPKAQMFAILMIPNPPWQCNLRGIAPGHLSQASTSRRAPCCHAPSCPSACSRATRPRDTWNSVRRRASCEAKTIIVFSQTAHHDAELSASGFL
jgi:hypothetical protein